MKAKLRRKRIIQDTCFAIRHFQKDKDFTPTTRELALFLGLKSHRAVTGRIRMLEENGLIEKVNMKRRYLKFTIRGKIYCATIFLRGY